jgi:hypothetical protein
MAEAVTVPISFAQTLLADALATNLAKRIPPPFALLQFNEALGLGLILPAAMPPARLAAELLAGLPATQTRPEASAAAHAAAKDWCVQFDTVQTWFEAGEEIEALLKPIPKTGLRVMIALFTYVFDRRLYWAARCAWMAATLKDSDHRCRADGGYGGRRQRRTKSGGQCVGHSRFPFVVRRSGCSVGQTYGHAKVKPFRPSVPGRPRREATVPPLAPRPPVPPNAPPLPPSPRLP